MSVTLRELAYNEPRPDITYVTSAAHELEMLGRSKFNRLPLIDGTIGAAMVATRLFSPITLF